MAKKGSRQRAILQEVKGRGGMRYMEIIEFVFKFNNPCVPWCPETNRGYYSGIFRKSGYSRYSGEVKAGWGTKLMTKIGKLYVINDKGIEILNKLNSKFSK